MNRLIIIAASILAVCRAATVIPTDISSVNVKQSGKDFSYTIQQNHGIAVDPSQVLQQIPIATSRQTFVSGSSNVDQKVMMDEISQPNIVQSPEQDKEASKKPLEQVAVIDYPTHVPHTFYIWPYPHYFIRYF